MRTPLTAFPTHKRGMPSRPVKSRSQGTLMLNHYFSEWANSPVYSLCWLVRQVNGRKTEYNDRTRQNANGLSRKNTQGVEREKVLPLLCTPAARTSGGMVWPLRMAALCPYRALGEKVRYPMESAKKKKRDWISRWFLAKQRQYFCFLNTLGVSPTLPTRVLTFPVIRKAQEKLVVQMKLRETFIF